MRTFVVGRFDSYENTVTLQRIQGETAEEALLMFLHKEGWVGDTVEQILDSAAGGDFYYSDLMEIEE